MANRRMEFFIGMTVIVIFVAVAIMTILFGPQQGLFVHGGGRRMKIVFEKANGITNTSRVLKNGVEVGRVYRRELREDAEGKTAEVEVFFELYPGIKIFSNEYAQIRRSLVGDASIEFVKNPHKANETLPKELDENAEIHGKPGSDLAGTVSNIEGDLAQALRKITDAAASLTMFMDNLKTFVGDQAELKQKKEKLARIFTELETTLKSINQLAGNMNEVITNKELRKHIQEGVAAVPKIVEKIDTLMGNVNVLTTDIRRTIDRSFSMFEQVEKNLSNLDDFTSALADQGPEFITSLSSSAKDVQKMVGNISDLAADLKNTFDNPDTPLGMLADKNTTLTVRRILENTASVTEKVHPILDDARVFSNKIAHKPSSLIWGGTTYKGSMVAPDRQYNFQSESPNGGLYSSLYKPTKDSGCTLFGGLSGLTDKWSGKADPRLDQTGHDLNNQKPYWGGRFPDLNSGMSNLTVGMPRLNNQMPEVSWNGYYGELPVGTVAPEGSMPTAVNGVPYAAGVGISEAVVQNRTPIQNEMPMQCGMPIQNEMPMQNGMSIQNEMPMQNGMSIQNEMPMQNGMSIQNEMPMQNGMSIQNGMPMQGGMTDGTMASSIPQMADDGYTGSNNAGYPIDRRARVVQPVRQSGTGRMQSSFKPIYRRIFGTSKKESTDTPSYNASQASASYAPQYSAMPQQQMYNNGNGYSSAMPGTENAGMYNSTYTQSNTEDFSLPGSSSERELVKRVPMTRAETTVERPISPEQNGTEELPSSILRKHNGSNRQFADDGLPMDVIN